MLPSAARLTKSQEFRLVVRRGRRAGRTRLVVHALRPDSPSFGAGHQDAGHAPSTAAHHGSAQPPTAPTRQSRVGFVVSKAVGTAVVRHRVARRLRHLMRSRLAHLPAGTLVVVRALPPAAQAPSTELGADIDAALRKLRLLDGRSVDSRDDDSGIRHGKLGRSGQ